MKEKLLSIQKDNSIIIYQFKYDQADIQNFINKLQAAYIVNKNDTIETTLIGNKPLSFHEYDDHDNCRIRKFEILDIYEQTSINDDLVYFPSESRAKLKLNIEFSPALAKIIENIFLNDEGCILNMTDIIKYTNYFFNTDSQLAFDKTIDLIRKNKKWNDKGRGFFNETEYNKYLNNIAKNINNINLNFTSLEAKHIKNDINLIIADFQELFEVEQIGMYPINLRLSYELEILKRFGIRNKDYDWHFDILENAIINYDGALILNKCSHNIIENYDLDGKRFEKDIIKKIEQYSNQKQFFMTKGRTN